MEGWDDISTHSITERPQCNVKAAHSRWSGHLHLPKRAGEARYGDCALCRAQVHQIDDPGPSILVSNA